ncbi:MAG: hypothetical protein IKV20_02080 [Clostridia bacterium]|nr:hypothetical protein [Clostridia bacterium]
MYINEDFSDNAAAIVERVLFALPRALAREILAVCSSRLGFPRELCEIRLRHLGACSLLFFGESVRLVSTVTREDIDAFLDRITEGSHYAYRDMIAKGYIPLGCGVRCGVCGVAGYEGERLIGVREISSLVIRLPFAASPFGEELLRAFSAARSGMLIFSPPGLGKTTALRSLISSLSSLGKRVAVIDERCELSGAYGADILSGYRRPDGIELAIRTLNPEVIVIDEIGKDEAEAVRRTLLCGVPMIATAHAGTRAEILAKPWLREMIDIGAFDVLVGLSSSGIEVTRAEVLV